MELEHNENKPAAAGVDVLQVEYEKRLQEAAAAAADAFREMLLPQGAAPWTQTPRATGPPTAIKNSTFPLLTRRDAVELIRAETGIPVPQSRFEKDAVAGRAPAPAAVYGRTHLYRRDAS